MVEKILEKIKPRKYQQEIFEKCKEKNCLVVLPTGIGKTLIALMLSIHTQRKFPASKTLFLAPTRPLVEQHFSYFKKNLPELFAELTLFTGKTPAEKRKELWESADIIFSTPQCLKNDLSNNLYDLKDVSLLIEDEAHRCIENYAYTYVAEKYRQQAKNQRILGLTASPGSDRNRIEQIAKNLGIETIEFRTRESEDVKPYLQELELEIITIDFPKEIEEITKIIKSLYQKKIDELKNRKLLFEAPTKTNILKLQGKIMSAISKGARDFNILSGAVASSQAIKLSHLIELLETQTLYSSINYIKSLFQQAAENKSRAVKQIVKNKEFNQAYIKINELLSKNIEHPKLFKLKETLELSIKENPKNKTIIFSQYRDTILRIYKELSTVEGINPKIFVGQAKKGETGLKQKDQQQIIEEFKEGKINVLIASTIGEEGLDIPEVNSVVFYEPIPSAIRRIQRAGRTARLMKGKLIILMTKGTLDEIFHYVSKSKEKKMYRSIEYVKKSLDEESNKEFFSNSTKEKQKTLF